jgi:hypothetical protein
MVEKTSTAAMKDKSFNFCRFTLNFFADKKQRRHCHCQQADWSRRPVWQQRHVWQQHLSCQQQPVQLT